MKDTWKSDKVECTQLSLSEGRFSVAENQRVPGLCTSTEDGCRVLFVCSLYSQLRGKFPLPLYGGLPRKERYCSLYSDFDDKFA